LIWNIIISSERSDEGKDMNAYRCLICGEVYTGREKPSHCPFCGAKGNDLVNAAEWIDENLGIAELSDISRRSLQTTLQLEVNNAPFYRDALLKTTHRHRGTLP